MASLVECPGCKGTHFEQLTDHAGVIRTAVVIHATSGEEAEVAKVYGCTRCRMVIVFGKGILYRLGAEQLERAEKTARDILEEAKRGVGGDRDAAERVMEKLMKGPIA